MSFIPLKSLKFPGLDDIYVNNPPSIAGQFSNNAQYSVGDFIYYNNVLYKFTVDHPVGNWNSEHVVAVTVADELSSKKADGAAALIADEFDANNSYVTGDYVIQGGKLYRFTADHATGAFDGSDVVEVTVADEMVSDVKINGTSILDNGVANIPVTAGNNFGVSRTYTTCGISINNDGQLFIYSATDNTIKTGTQNYQPIVPLHQHASTFYGLAKAAGVDLANETVTLGTYPNTAKTAIRAMIGLSDAEIVSIVEAGLPSAEGVNW